MWRSLGQLLRSPEGAIVPTVALSLAGLVAVGGIAFDYSRVASMDTELQSAADQAALAAATQLDGEDGARARARAAARDLIANLTYFANDGEGTAVDIPEANIIFYEDYSPDTGEKGPVADSDEDANYVLVTVGARRANYALTPIVAALTSGDMAASAFATLDSAYCNLPPFMMCKPSGTFDATANIGKGMRLIIDNPVAPGNFGFLQTGFGSGAENLAKALGWNGSAGGCVAARGVITEPGNKQSVRAALNTRFDLSESGQTCPAGGSCSPSTNSRKDLVHGTGCTTSGGQAWAEPPVPYRARNTTALSPTNPMIDRNPVGQSANDTVYPDTMGHPRDMCHAVSEAGTCGGIIGNGSWDRDAYFWINYGWTAPGTGADAWTTKTGLSATATRYQVYLWEAANPLPNGSTGKGIGNNQSVGTGGNTRWASSWTGSTPAPQRTCRAPGVPPGDLDTDRRVMPVAVVDCTGHHGRDVVKPLDWVDVFLVEPTFSRGTGANARTGDGDVYVEIIGTRPLPGPNQTIGNVLRRDVPRLIE